MQIKIKKGFTILVIRNAKTWKIKFLLLMLVFPRKAMELSQAPEEKRPWLSVLFVSF